MTYVPPPSASFMDGQSGQQSPSAPAVRPPLRRSSTDRMLGGVCGGLAEHTGIDALIWRVGFVGLTVAGGAGVLVYLLLWVLMDPAPRGTDEQPGQFDRVAEQLHDKVYASRWMPPRT